MDAEISEKLKDISLPNDSIPETDEPHDMILEIERALNEEVTILQKPNSRTKNSDVFPWVKSILNSIKSHSMSDFTQQYLLQLMDVYIKHASENLSICVRVPGRCYVSCRNISRVMFLFKNINSQFDRSNDYLTKMCELLAIYTFLELRYSLKFEEMKLAVSNRISLHYKTHLESEDAYYCLKVLINIKSYFKQNEIMCMLLQKYLKRQPSSGVLELSDKLFVMHLIGFKLWRELVRTEEEQLNIENLANSTIQPSATLSSNKKYAPYIPKYKLDDEFATAFILKQHFSVSILIKAVNEDNDCEVNGLVQVIDLCHIEDETSVEIANEDLPSSIMSNGMTIDLAAEEELRSKETKWIDILKNNALSIKPVHNFGQNNQENSGEVIVIDDDSEEEVNGNISGEINDNIEQLSNVEPNISKIDSQENLVRENNEKATDFSPNLNSEVINEKDFGKSNNSMTTGFDIEKIIPNSDSNNTSAKNSYEIKGIKNSNANINLIENHSTLEESKNKDQNVEILIEKDINSLKLNSNRLLQEKTEELSRVLEPKIYSQIELDNEILITDKSENLEKKAEQLGILPKANISSVNKISKISETQKEIDKMSEVKKEMLGTDIEKGQITHPNAEKIVQNQLNEYEKFLSIVEDSTETDIIEKNNSFRKVTENITLKSVNLKSELNKGETSLTNLSKEKRTSPNSINTFEVLSPVSKKSNNLEVKKAMEHEKSPEICTSPNIFTSTFCEKPIKEQNEVNLFKTNISLISKTDIEVQANTNSETKENLKTNILLSKKTENRIKDIEASTSHGNLEEDSEQFSYNEEIRRTPRSIFDNSRKTYERKRKSDVSNFLDPSENSEKEIEKELYDPIIVNKSLYQNKNTTSKDNVVFSIDRKKFLSQPSLESFDAKQQGFQPSVLFSTSIDHHHNNSESKDIDDILSPPMESFSMSDKAEFAEYLGRSISSNNLKSINKIRSNILKQKVEHLSSNSNNTNENTKEIIPQQAKASGTGILKKKSVTFSSPPKEKNTNGMERIKFKHNSRIVDKISYHHSAENNGSNQLSPSNSSDSQQFSSSINQTNVHDSNEHVHNSGMHTNKLDNPISILNELDDNTSSMKNFSFVDTCGNDNSLEFTTDFNNCKYQVYAHVNSDNLGPQKINVQNNNQCTNNEIMSNDDDWVDLDLTKILNELCPGKRIEGQISLPLKKRRKLSQYSDTISIKEEDFSCFDNPKGNYYDNSKNILGPNNINNNNNDLTCDGISYPSTPMLSIANFENMICFAQQPRRQFKTPAQLKEISPVNLQTFNILPTQHTIVNNSGSANCNELTRTVQTFNILPSQQTVANASLQTFNIIPPQTNVNTNNNGGLYGEGPSVCNIQPTGNIGFNINPGNEVSAYNLSPNSIQYTQSFHPTKQYTYNIQTQQQPGQMNQVHLPALDIQNMINLSNYQMNSQHLSNFLHNSQINLQAKQAVLLNDNIPFSVQVSNRQPNNVPLGHQNCEQQQDCFLSNKCNIGQCEQQNSCLKQVKKCCEYNTCASTTTTTVAATIGTIINNSTSRGKQKKNKNCKTDRITRSSNRTSNKCYNFDGTQETKTPNTKKKKNSTCRIRLSQSLDTYEIKRRRLDSSISPISIRRNSQNQFRYFEGFCVKQEYLDRNIFYATVKLPNCDNLINRNLFITNTISTSSAKPCNPTQPKRITKKSDFDRYLELKKRITKKNDTPKNLVISSDESKHKDKFYTNNNLQERSKRRKREPGQYLSMLRHYKRTPTKNSTLKSNKNPINVKFNYNTKDIKLRQRAYVKLRKMVLKSLLKNLKQCQCVSNQNTREHELLKSQNIQNNKSADFYSKELKENNSVKKNDSIMNDEPKEIINTPKNEINKSNDLIEVNPIILEKRYESTDSISHEIILNQNKNSESENTRINGISIEKNGIDQPPEKTNNSIDDIERENEVSSTQGYGSHSAFKTENSIINSTNNDQYDIQNDQIGTSNILNEIKKSPKSKLQRKPSLADFSTSRKNSTISKRRKTICSDIRHDRVKEVIFGNSIDVSTTVNVLDTSKRKRGRPKGSKNKRKSLDDNTNISFNNIFYQHDGLREMISCASPLSRTIVKSISSRESDDEPLVKLRERLNSIYKPNTIVASRTESESPEDLNFNSDISKTYSKNSFIQKVFVPPDIEKIIEDHEDEGAKINKIKGRNRHNSGSRR